jgi:hypothetical protein
MIIGDYYFMKRVNKIAKFIFFGVLFININLASSQTPINGIPVFHKADNEPINELKTLCFDSLSFVEESRFVYPATTAAAIDELNSLVPNYDDRRNVLIRIKKLEDQGKVILSTEEYQPIQKRIAEAPINPTDEFEVEWSVYANTAKKTYVLITDLIAN